MSVKKKISRFISVVLVLMLCMVFATPVMAKTELYTGKTVQFNNILNVNANAVLPASLEFEYTLTGTAPEDDISGFDPYAGDVTNVTVSGASGATVSSMSGGKFKVTYTNADKTTGNTVIKKSFIIDFSSLTFAAPGVYRYTLTETSKNDTRVDYSGQTYYIDLFVDAELDIVNIVVSKDGEAEDSPSDTDDNYEKKVDATPSGTDNKADFENTWKSYDLTITKTVSGNQGDLNKKFSFTLSGLANASGLPDGTYTVVVGSTGNTAAITVSDGTVDPDYEFSLANNESITIKDLPYGTTWSVTEATYSDYQTTVPTMTEAVTAPDTNDITQTGRTVSDSTTGIRGNTSITYENAKPGTIPTGILLTIAPFAALMLIGIVGAAVILKKKKATEK